MVRILIEALLYCFFILNVNCLSFAREETPQVSSLLAARSAIVEPTLPPCAIGHLIFSSSRFCTRGRHNEAKILLLLYIAKSS